MKFSYIHKLVDKSDPILHKVSELVPLNHDVKEIVETMKNVMDEGLGVGLSAVQIGILYRIIVVKYKGEEFEIINPKLVRQSGGKTVEEEGCLSFPGEFVKKKRYNRIKVTGFDKDWNPISLNLKNFVARIVLHELDHLNGVTIK